MWYFYLPEFEDKVQAQQFSFSELKAKLAADYDANILLMKSDMKTDMDERIAFLKKSTADCHCRQANQQEKSAEDSRLKHQLQAKDGELLDLRSRLDLLEASSKSSARVAAEQV
jgi:hypothetical protein